MKSYYQFLPRFLWIAVSSIIFVSNVQGQVSPSGDRNTLTSASCVGCTVQSPELARDGSLTTAARFDITGLPIGVQGTISRDYFFNTDLQLGADLVLTMSFDEDSLLANSSTSSNSNATIFDRVQIDLLDQGTIVASYGGNGISAQMAEVDVYDPSTSSFNIVIVIPISSVDEVRVTAGMLTAPSTSFTPSDLELFDVRVETTDRYYSNRHTNRSGQVGLVLQSCVQCGVQQPELAETPNADPNYEYAQFRWNAGLSLVGIEYQFAEYDWGPNPVLALLGDSDGIKDRVNLILQEHDVLDLGISNLGMGLWNNGGINLFVTYTDGTQVLYDENSALLSASAMGTQSERFMVQFDIPTGKTVDRVEVRRRAPTLGISTELRLFSLFTTPEPIFLPTNLTDFSAVKSRTVAKLQWIVENEAEVRSFEVERSINGIDFELLQSLECQNHGVGKSTYQYEDKYPVIGGNYYRLKMKTMLGDCIYSPIRVLVFDDLQPIYTVTQSGTTLVITASQIVKKEDKTKIVLSTYDGKLIKAVPLEAGTTQASIDYTNQWGNTLLVSIVSGNRAIQRQIINNY